MRMRRIRNNKLLRKMTEETTLSVSDFIYPLFVVEGEDIKREIPSMPGVYHFSVDRLDDEIKELVALHIPAVILFGVVNHKAPSPPVPFTKNAALRRNPNTTPPRTAWNWITKRK